MSIIVLCQFPMTDPWCCYIYIPVYLSIYGNIYHQYPPVMLAYILYTSTMDPSWVCESPNPHGPAAFLINPLLFNG